MLDHSASPAPRPGVASKTLYLTSITSTRDSASSYQSYGEKLPERLEFDIVPITSGGHPRECSHFSPNTPGLEKGFKHTDTGERTKFNPLNAHIARLFSWKPEGNVEGPETGRSAIWLLLLFILVILFLFANVIYLDILINERNQQLAEIAARLPTAASFSLPASASPSPSTSVASPSPSPTGPVNLASVPLNEDAQTCLTQFSSSVATDPAFYCGQCIPAINNIPIDWFVAQAKDRQDGPTRLQKVSDVTDFCSNLTRGELGGD